jgi:hypothetical protein
MVGFRKGARVPSGNWLNFQAYAHGATPRAAAVRPRLVELVGIRESGEVAGGVHRTPAGQGAEAFTEQRAMDDVVHPSEKVR